MYSATVSAPVNIATLKYWGKRDKTLNLPTNSSISVTLAQIDLKTTTTASCSAKYSHDQLFLNGVEEDLAKSPKFTRVFVQLRELRTQLELQSELPKLAVLPLRIDTSNNFPTAAGLASSAAGYAALVFSIATLYQLPASASDLSVLARQGSGSACRSLFGGYVAWEMGSKADGSDSRAIQVAPQEHWPQMRAAVLVANPDKKDTPSTSGMQQTVASSTLFGERINTVVPKRYQDMTDAICKRDFATFAHLTMQDSNQFHAVCLDSYPPIFYLNDTSRAAIRAVEQINAHAGTVICAYTFDAGPNAVVYYLEENEAQVLGPLKHAVGHVDGWAKTQVSPVSTVVEPRWSEVLARGVCRVILTSVGPGPQIISTSW